MLSALRLRPEDALTDYAPWYRLLKTHALIFGVNFLLFAASYFVLSWLVEQPKYFHYLERMLSHFFVVILFAQVATIVGFHWQLSKRVFAAFLYQPTSPYNLATMRFAVMATLAGHLLLYVPNNLAQVASLPHSARAPLPLMGWFIDNIPISTGLYAAIVFTGGILCTFAALGLFTRWSFLLSIPFLFYALGVPNFFGKLNHSHFLLWAPIFLSFSPAGEVWSLDALIKKRRGQPLHQEPHYRYGVPMKLIFLQLGLIYFFSAVGKLWLGGLQWALSDNLVYLMQLEWLENYGSVPAIRLDQFPILCKLLAAGVIAFELAYVFLIVTPRFRPWTGLAAIGFHNVTSFFLNIDFGFLQLMNFFMLDLNKGLRWILARRQWWLSALLLAAALPLLYHTSHILGPALIFCTALLVLKRFVSFPTTEIAVLPKPPLSKWVLRVGLGLLSINFCFGLAQQSSWPFSAFPSYSFVRSGVVKYIWFRPATQKGQTLDLDELGKAIGYLKEGILPLAERGVKLWEKGKIPEFKAHVLSYWLRYREMVPELKEAVETKVLFQVLSTNPDRSDEPIQEFELGQLLLENGKWVWKLN